MLFIRRTGNFDSRIACVECWGSDSVVVQTRRSTVEPKSKRLRVLDEFEDEDSVADVMATVTQYLSVNEEPSDELRADPLLYWRNSRFVGLASLAKNYLTASASSVPWESNFSISGMLLNGRRSSLAPHTFNRLIFIHDNLDKFWRKDQCVCSL